MLENPENTSELEINRRGFLHRLGLGMSGAIAASSPFLPQAEAAPAPVANTEITHVPSTVQELMALDEKQRTLLAIATVSGADAVGYYANQDGALVLQQHMDIYPTLETAFKPEITYNNQTHDTDAHIRENSEYQLAVRGQDGSLQGVIVLHAPEGDLSRVQTEEQAGLANNLNEPPAMRHAKITMAEHILEAQKTKLLPSWQQLALKGQRPDSGQDKQAYFKMLRNDFIEVMGKDSTQSAHVQGVADLMMVAVDKVINTPEKTIIDAKHKAMLEDITVLHDVGKLQTSVPFLVKPWRNDDVDLNTRRYFMEQNHNHPLFTYVALSAFPHEALTAAAHHHGVLRYTDKELEKGLGADYAKHRILKDNVPFEQLSALSKFMRVSDVTESITGDRANKSITQAIKQMAERAGYDADTKSFKPVTHDCNSIDPDILCMMIDNDFFKSYGKMREQQMNGWKDPNGVSKYDEKSVEAISNEVLAAYHWKERKTEVEAKLRGEVQQDALLNDAPQRQVQANGRQNSRFS